MCVPDQQFSKGMGFPGGYDHAAMVAHGPCRKGGLLIGTKVDGLPQRITAGRNGAVLGPWRLCVAALESPASDGLDPASHRSGHPTPCLEVLRDLLRSAGR